MIEKLSEYKITRRNGAYINADCNTKIINTLVQKINELVDAVNTIQKEREAEWFEIKEWIGILEAVRKSVNKLEAMAKNTNTVLESLVEENNIHEKQIDELQMKVEPEKCEIHIDQYAEQQKWIGRLCKFWDYDGEEKWFSALEHIDKNSPYPYCASGDWWYKHCEPVGLDDLIIYKGDNNE